MTRVLILEQVPLLAVGIRSTLECMTDWQIQTARQDSQVIAQMVEDERQDRTAHHESTWEAKKPSQESARLFTPSHAASRVADITILDDTYGTVLDLLDKLGWQHVPSLGMTVVVTGARRSEDTLLYLARWGVAAYLGAATPPEAFAETVRRVSEGCWMLTSEWIASPPCRQQQENVPGCADTTSSVLTLREIEVLRHVALGKSNKEIARALLLSDQTIKNHLTSIYKKLSVGDRTAAVVAAIRRELIKMPAGSTTSTRALYASVA